MPADTMGAASPRQASGQGLGRLQTSGLANTGARPHNQRGSVRDTSWARALIAVWIVGVCYGAYSVFGTNDKETAHVERRQRSNPAGGSMVGDAQFVAVKDFLMPPMRDGHRRPPGTGAGGGRVAETSRLSQQRWKKSALEKINSIREEAERPATNAAPVAALSQPRGLLKKAELDLQPLQHSPTGEFDPDSLPVHQCGYNNEPLKPWMNPADWNTSETRGGVDLHHPSKMSPILVMGCGHSGTTYLISCIGRHPTVHLRFSHELNKETPICMSESHFTTQNLASRWEQDAQAKGKTHWAIKAPSNICCLGYIFKFVPNGRAIVVVRDGRDVLMSLAKRYSSIPDYPVDELMMRWVNDNLMALYYARDPRCLIVRYEDLVAEPKATLGRIFKFSGVAATAAEVVDALGGESELHEKPSQPPGRKGNEHDALRDWQTKQPLYNDTSRWATEPMSRKLAEVVSRNKYALAMLYEFGYSRREDGSDWLPRFLAP